MNLRSRWWIAALTLSACVRPLAAQDPVVPLVLNHLTMVLDSATWHDVSVSPFFRQEFAALGRGFEDARHAPLLVLVGKYDYLALAGPDGKGNQSGDVDIVVGVETPGALPKLARLTGLASTTIVQNDGTPPAPYGEIGSTQLVPAPGATSAHTHFAIMQFGAGQAEVLARRDSQPLDVVRNARFLAPYFDAQRDFEYLSGVTVAVPVEDITAITGVLRRAGVEITPEGEGAVIHLSGFTLRLMPPWGGAGVKRLEFGLTGTVPANPTYRFGPRSVLRFGPGPVAVWDFTGQ